MTARRDLKKRVRARQSQTGEPYTTALQHVLRGRPRPPVPVVLELVDLSAEAAEMGMHGRVIMFPELAARVEARTALLRIRNLLLATESDPKTAVFRSLLLRGELPKALEREESVNEAAVMFALVYSEKLIARPEVLRERMSASLAFLTRAQAGIGGASESGLMLAVPVEGRQGLEHVVCLAWGLPLHTYVILRSARSMLEDPSIRALPG